MINIIDKMNDITKKDIRKDRDIEQVLKMTENQRIRTLKKYKKNDQWTPMF